MSVCLSVCLRHPKLPMYGCCGDFWSKNVFIILACDAINFRDSLMSLQRHFHGTATVLAQQFKKEKKRKKEIYTPGRRPNQTPRRLDANTPQRRAPKNRATSPSGTSEQWTVLSKLEDLPCSTVYVRWLTSKSQSQLVFKIHIFPGHLFVDEFQHCNHAVTFESEYEIFSLLEWTI